MSESPPKNPLAHMDRQPASERQWCRLALVQATEHALRWVQHPVGDAYQAVIQTLEALEIALQEADRRG